MGHIYANGVMVGMAEMGRFSFKEVTNDGNGERVVDVAQIAVPVEIFRNMYAIMGQTIQAYDDNMAKQAETNKKLS